MNQPPMPPDFATWCRRRGIVPPPALAPPPIPAVPTLPVVMIGGIPFSGPVLLSDAPDAFAGWHGVYLITRQDRAAQPPVYVGVSGVDIGDRIAGHEWRGRWNLHAFGHPLLAYAHIEDDDGERLNKEAFLRQLLNPLSGVR